MCQPLLVGRAFGDRLTTVLAERKCRIESGEISELSVITRWRFRSRESGTATQPTGRRRKMSSSKRWQPIALIVALFLVVLSTAAVRKVGALISPSSTPAVPLSFVSIEPCRLADTRSNGVGTRLQPLGSRETATFSIWGTNGYCTIPNGATAITANITITNPTAASFLTLYPTGGNRPEASNLNWIAGDAPTPNSVNVKLSPNGAVSVYNNAGRVDVIIDIAGYYVPSADGPQGPTGPQGAQGAQGIQGIPGVPGSTGPIYSSRQLAMQRWETGFRAADFQVGGAPRGLAFDGVSIWVSNYDSNTVSKIDRVTGSKVDYPTGLQPDGLAFDGTNIWIANSGENTVSRMNTATGSRVDFPSANAPRRFAFDGENLWVTNSNSGSVSKFDPILGARVDFPIGKSMQGIAFDGVWIWAADSEDGIVAKINRTDGSYVKYATGQGAMGVAFDGSRIWVSNMFANTVSRVDRNGVKKDLQVMGPSDLAADGSNIWVSSWMNDSAVKIDLSIVDTNFPSIPYYDVGDYPIGILYDGLNIWTANNLSGTITKLVD